MAEQHDTDKLLSLARECGATCKETSPHTTTSVLRIAFWGDELTALEQRIRQDEREKCADMADAWSRPSVIKLAAGEMSAQELRTAQAVARGIAADIRSGASHG